MLRKRFSSKFQRGLSLLGRPRELAGYIVGPKVLMVSIPKAGTHLLLRALDLFPQLRAGSGLVFIPEEERIRRISMMKPGQIVRMHAPRSPILDNLIERNDIRVFYIVRDPRDVCVSYMYYCLNEPKHNKHDYFSSLLNNEERLLVTITGFTGEHKGQKIWIGPIDHYYRHFYSWSLHPSCCTIRFEELVGPNGGGDQKLQLATIQRLADHINFQLSAREINQIANNLYTPESPTFRRGQIGSWRDEMTNSQIKKVKEIAGQLLIDLGYETHLDW